MDHGGLNMNPWNTEDDCMVPDSEIGLEEEKS
jgi:hypothetical protein